MEFRHEPLKLSGGSIRLLQVQSGTKNDVIRIRITQFAVHHRPPYVAISYTWGNATDLRQIHVNGLPYPIHKNLWHLLYHLRQRGESQFLWVDALSIDQRNLAERNFHVQFMSQIYDRAESTIVWLGLPSNDRWEARAMDFIREISMYSERSFKDLYLTEAHQQRWHNLVRLCRCVYWTRTWIIQEFLRARKLEVICGTASLQWDCFEVLVGIVTDLYKDFVTPSPSIAQLIETIPFRLTKRRMFHQHSSLRDLLHEFHDSQCAEPRDKIYGILGIADDCGEDAANRVVRGPIPDYGKHIVEVYLEVIKYLSETSANLAVTPLTALLVQQSLKLTHEQIREYIKLSQFECASATFNLVPDYMNVITDILPSYTSIRDLRQKLETFPWSRYVDTEIPARKIYNKSKRRKSSTSNTASSSASSLTLTPSLKSSLIPIDLISTALNTASTDDVLDRQIVNYPDTTSFAIPATQIVMHPEDKKRLNNTSLAKPQIIIESSENLAEPLRIGFACTDTRRGDLIVQFKGLDLALIARKVRGEHGGLRIVGTALMIHHSGLRQTKQKRAGDEAGGIGGGRNGWISGYLGRYRNIDQGGFDDAEDIVLRTDPLSLGCILMDAI